MNVSGSDTAFFIRTANLPSSPARVLATLSAAFKTSFVVAAQLVVDLRWTAYLEANSLPHGHVKHADHAYRDHPGQYPVNPFTRLFEIFPFSVVHVSLR